MRKNTDQFKIKIRENGRQIDSKITSGELELGGSELNAVTPVLQSSLLKSVMKELDIDSNVLLPVGNILNYKFGVKLDNGEFEYINMGDYVVKDVEKQEDSNSYNITCYDFMLYSMREYENLKSAEILGKSFPMSVREYITCLCADLSLTFKNSDTEFVNYNRMMPEDLYANLGYTYRDILDELAQVTASNIIINEENEVEIKYINETDIEIDGESLKNINVAFGQKYGPINSIVLSRSAGADNVYLRDEQSVIDNGLCELKISDNQIMNFNDRSDYLPGILNQLNGLEYYVNDFESTGIIYLEVADAYKVKIEDNDYRCILFNSQVNITTGLEEIIHTDLPEQAETDYTKADKTDRRLNQTYLIVDKQNQTIESMVSHVEGYDEKFTRMQQTIDELRQEISHTVGLTISGETVNASLEINGVAEGEPMEITVRPYSEDIGKTYPKMNIYPGDNTFTKADNAILRIENIETNEYTDFEIPETLFYLDGNTYDVLQYVYGNNKCTITQNVGFVDGQPYKLDTPVVTEYDFPSIPLKEGNYRIYLVGYDYGYIYFKTMAKNDYTNLFATKVELRSAITQTEDKIESEVGKVTTLYDKEIENLDSRITQTADSITQTVTEQVNGVKGELDLYIRKGEEGKDDLISGFNLNTNEVIINSDNFKLDAQGNIEANSATLVDANINGGKIYIVDDGLASEPSITIETAPDPGGAAHMITDISSYGLEFETKFLDRTDIAAFGIDGIKLKTVKDGSTVANPIIDINTYDGIKVTNADSDYYVNVGVDIAKEGNMTYIELGEQVGNWLYQNLQLYPNGNIISQGDIFAENVSIIQEPTDLNHAVRLQDLQNATANVIIKHTTQQRVTCHSGMGYTNIDIYGPSDATWIANILEGQGYVAEVITWKLYSSDAQIVIGWNNTTNQDLSIRIDITSLYIRN